MVTDSEGSGIYSLLSLPSWLTKISALVSRMSSRNYSGLTTEFTGKAEFPEPWSNSIVGTDVYETRIKLEAVERILPAPALP